MRAGLVRISRRVVPQAGLARGEPPILPAFDATTCRRGAAACLMQRRRIAVAPLRGGGGTKVKILEAWAHRRPVVATSHAARGLGAVPGRHLLIADTAAQFAHCCKRIFDDPVLAGSLADAGHARLRECFLLSET